MLSALAADTASFDSTGSTDPDGTVVTYAWDFGDGQTLPDGGPTPTHSYAAPGTYTANVTVTDNEGCSSTFVFTGQTAHCTGSAAASASVTIDTELSGARLKAKKKQEQKPDQVKIKLKAGADEQVALVAKGKVTVKAAGKARRVAPSKSASYKLKKAKSSAAAGELAKLTLKPKSSKDAKRISAALADETKATAKITVKFTDLAGNTATKKVGIKLG